MTRQTNDMNHDTHNTPIDDLELLITRMVDGEASDTDRQTFERHAQAEPGLWRTLAQRQDEMRCLTEQFEDEVAVAVDVAPPTFIRTVSPVRWGIALSGWAAMIALALVLGIVLQQSRPVDSNVRPVGGDDHPGVVTTVDDVTFEQHLQEYLNAPYVVGEFDPTLLEVQELSDGRLGITIMRRIGEVVLIEHPEELPVNEFGTIDINPDLLREMLDAKQAEAAIPKQTH